MRRGSRMYLDYAAAAPLDPLVREAMKPYWEKIFANANALHSDGRAAKEALERARAEIEKYIGASANEITFTSGGTEANGLAILGAAGAGQDLSERHFITTAIEHPSVLDTFRALERRGAAVSYVGVGKDGIVQAGEIQKALRRETALVSVMYANNEIGSVQPIAEIGHIVKKHRASLQPQTPTFEPLLFHTDASQAPLFARLDVEKLGADMLSLDAHKLYGPKGVGALFVRRGVSLEPVFFGGRQEGGLRPGTENVAGAVGFAKAFEITEARRRADNSRLGQLQQRFFDAIAREFPEAVINGSREHRLPNNINVSFPGINAEFLALALDARGISSSTRSACLEGGDEGSYVIAALHTGHANSALRFTLGRQTAADDIDEAVAVIRDVLPAVRYSYGKARGML